MNKHILISLAILVLTANSGFAQDAPNNANDNAAKNTHNLMPNNGQKSETPEAPANLTNPNTEHKPGICHRMNQNLTFEQARSRALEYSANLDKTTDAEWAERKAKHQESMKNAGITVDHDLTLAEARQFAHNYSEKLNKMPNDEWTKYRANLDHWCNMTPQEREAKREKYADRKSKFNNSTSDKPAQTDQ
ncbi:MAG: hypothetical protein WCL30_05575, partial [Pseudomonadota bacterium]